MQPHAEAAQGAVADLQGAAQQLDAPLDIFQRGAFRLAVSAVQVLGQRFQIRIRAAAVVLHKNVKRIAAGFKAKLDAAVFYFLHAVVIGVFKHGLQNKAGHTQIPVLLRQGLELHRDAIAEADGLNFRIVHNVLIFHGQGDHRLGTAGDIAIVGAQLHAHFRDALGILHLRHAVKMIEAVVQEVGIDLCLQVLDLGLVGQLLAVIRLLQGILQLAAQLDEGAVQKVHILASVGIGQQDAGVLHLLQLLYDPVERPGDQLPHQEYEAARSHQRDDGLHHDPDRERRHCLPQRVGTDIARGPQPPLPHRLQGAQAVGAVHSGGHHAGGIVCRGSPDVRQDRIGGEITFGADGGKAAAGPRAVDGRSLAAGGILPAQPVQLLGGKPGPYQRRGGSAAEAAGIRDHIQLPVHRQHGAVARDGVIGVDQLLLRVRGRVVCTGGMDAFIQPAEIYRGGIDQAAGILEAVKLIRHAQHGFIQRREGGRRRGQRQPERDRAGKGVFHLGADACQLTVQPGGKILGLRRIGRLGLLHGIAAQPQGDGDAGGVNGQRGNQEDTDEPAGQIGRKVVGMILGHEAPLLCGKIFTAAGLFFCKAL